MNPTTPLMYKICSMLEDLHGYAITEFYAKADIDPILDEVQRLRDEREYSYLWKDAPKNAAHMIGVFQNTSGIDIEEFAYHRDIPKTIEQETVEKIVETFCNAFCPLSAWQKDELYRLIEHGMNEIKEYPK